MELSLIILQQTLQMAIYMAMGFLLFRFRKIDKNGSKTLASILLWLVIPSTIINSFSVERSTEKIVLFGISLLLGVLAEVVAVTVARLLFAKKGIDQFAASFSNAGYIGIPLIQACFGGEAVFYLVGMILVLNLLQWTYGASIIKKDTFESNTHEKMHKDMLLNPITVSAFVGIAIFLSGAGNHLPVIVKGCITGVAATNAPLAMLVLGVYLAQTDLRTLFTDRKLLFTSGIRLVLIPLITLVIFALIPADSQIRMTILIAAAAPVGANVAVYAQMYNADYPYASKTVTQSTLLSIVTLPLFIALARLLVI